MPSVLFVCTGNQFRSPIAAEAFRVQLHRDGRDRHWAVKSAGTWTHPGQPALRAALEAARSLGLDLTGHTPREVDAHLLREADLVLVMEAGHKESLAVEFSSAKNKVYLLTEVLEGRAYDIPDPARAPGETLTILSALVAMIQTKSAKIYARVEAG